MFLWQHFRAFAAALVEIKALAATEPVERIRSQAAALIGQHRKELERSVPRLDPAREREYLYLLAAFADETFLTLDWPGRAAWRNHLVETQFCGSRAAGTRVFQQIDELLADRDTARAPMAMVYLLMLGLGFRGRFRSADADGEIEHRRTRLGALIEQSQPEWQSAGLASQAYEHTVQEGALQRLPSPARWWSVAAGVTLAWLAGSYVAWQWIADPLSEQMQSVERRVAASPKHLVGRLR